MMGDKHSAKPVKLSDLIEEMDFQSDERSAFLNLTTGEVVSVTDEELRAAENGAPLEDFPEWQHDAIRLAGEIVETDHYLPLPDRFEINEYRIMERFCLLIDDEDMRDDLCNAIRGRGAFRYFKDRIHAYGIAEEWYQYRDAALREIAIAWCEAHDIPYTET
jgi:hypothetical protein